MNDEEFALTLRIYHPRYRPEEIAEKIGMIPAVANGVGDIRATPSGTPLNGIYKETYCAFKIQRKTAGYFVETLRQVACQLSPKSNIFEDFNRTGGRCEIYVGVFVKGSSGFTLSAKDLTLLVRTGLEISVEYYW